MYLAHCISLEATQVLKDQSRSKTLYSTYGLEAFQLDNNYLPNLSYRIVLLTLNYIIQCIIYPWIKILAYICIIVATAVIKAYLEFTLFFVKFRWDGFSES